MALRDYAKRRHRRSRGLPSKAGARTLRQPGSLLGSWAQQRDWRREKSENGVSRHQVMDQTRRQEIERAHRVVMASRESRKPSGRKLTDSGDRTPAARWQPLSASVGPSLQSWLETGSLSA